MCLIIGSSSLFLLQPAIHSVELTETATLGCFALGYSISYQWVIGSRLFPSKVNGINDGTLIIPDVRLSDENSYICVATTMTGCVLLNSTQLKVTGMIIIHNLITEIKSTV